MIEVPEDILLYAFRYALGRRSYAVGLVANQMMIHRDSLKRFSKTIVEDIESCTYYDKSLDRIDLDVWDEIRDVFKQETNPTSTKGVANDNL